MSFFTIVVIVTIIAAAGWFFLPSYPKVKTAFGYIAFIGAVLWVLLYFNVIHIG
jgi:hypothetical protein